MKTLNILTHAARILVGLVFIFSAFVKGVDPMGLNFKLEDYFIAYKMSFLLPLALPAAIFFILLEFLIGVSLIFGTQMFITAWALFLTMSYFTILTLISAITNSVDDCGCFGDAIVLTNWETFFKNVFLMLPTILIFIRRKKFNQIFGIKTEWGIICSSILLMLCIDLWGLLYEPIIDFRPWKVNSDIKQKLIGTPAESKFFIEYKNPQTGEVKKYLSTEIPYNDSNWVNQNWQFVKTTEEVTKSAIPPKILKFAIIDNNGDDYMDEFINYKGASLWIISYDLKEANLHALNKIDKIVKEAKTENINVIGITGTSNNEISEILNNREYSFNFYSSDDIVLKTVLRSNPGVMLINNGVIIQKWAHRCFPENFEEIQKLIIP
ncbi:MAG: hypothetical protein A2X12_03315 [Bacteroidetes bacterium GWE2_29_8]|nr:MAG: hypothetical protein A2X12_03315 [Bacteroidetes bacterium GWE2_29_8]OFY14133.1 MAG: hypothetical protein A2X02_02560 [Bacteroidetes bacterium GWF2_29_10]